MCGLIAAWDPSGLDETLLVSALGDLRHRGPDAQATVWRENHRVHLAHARLKIIDTSDGANQPFVSPCGRWALVFNGEIYNYLALRAEIGDRWQWRTRGDTEVLLAAWALWGSACLDKLVGMFAFALHDAQLHQLTLVRDRFGIKPLYRVKGGSTRIFASEIPPLLRFLSRVAPDNSTILTYLEHGLYDHGVNTFFAGVEALEPGSLIEIDLNSGAEQQRRWYRLVDHVPDLTGASEAELLEQTEELIVQAVRSHLVSDVAVGLNVSGGVDSSMLVRTTLAELGHAHLFTQDYEGYSELPWVNEISEGGTLHVANLDLNRINGYLPQTVRSQAEPFGGVTVCGYNALYELARQEDVTVLLDGNGVDEVFLGYKRHHQIYAASAASPPERERLAADFETFWGERPKAVRPGASIDGTDGLRPQALTAQLRACAPYVEALPVAFSSPVRQAAADDLLRAKIPRGLRFNDRVSMAHSRELRVPFLDHRLVEFGFGIPEEFLFGAQGTKLLFRKLLARRASGAVAFSAKRSVQSPQREWLANEWQGLVKEVLGSESFRARGWVDAHKAQQSYELYLSGTQENSFFIWQWVNLELWARAFLDGSVGR
ncbi:asparagine synthase (glutamine-hydrolyzing) [Rhodoferax sp.]|uniref:asparagine synthase (glutamine-hydrolyzing) n=1 Tax=Rhodoferax sp. TaxID=50421 RepID=UPI001ED53FFB|nr:asparagine synthase (glutamine-hydrolyzing) [Rhodoferax sp.]MBT9507328.1 asparagine synthase (glutamine-hydrolyzing) [Rhodoferax sp.]